MAGSDAPQLRLSAEQQAGSHPERHVWLAASAGTGKTSVLSARVLRLLLREVKPDAILCLTFTKAGATAMATRVHETLTQWVRMKGPEIAADLMALGEAYGPKEVLRARSLFAEVLEARGGGLRIMTIHSFCQTLLAGFPLEAGLSPGFRPVEGREAAALERQVLSAMIVDAELTQPQLIADLRTLSLRMGEDKVIAWLRRAGASGTVLEELSRLGVEAPVRRGLGLPSDFRAGDLVKACQDGAFDRAALDALATSLASWGSSRAGTRPDAVCDWLAAEPKVRVRTLNALIRAWRKADGELFETKGWVPTDPDYAPLVERLDAWCAPLVELAGRAELAEAIAAALRAGHAYARAYAEAKRVRGLVDFDDLIAHTRALLGDEGTGAWIRYKLDSATDHILVDEAQDTNADQWAIIEALADEYWAGAGAKDGVLRTLFAVGDFKQAIFGFQGTDPRFYKRAGLSFGLKAENAGDELHELSLTQSFRSTPPVLEVVDAVLDELGSDAVGIADGFEPHVSSDPGGPGQVILLPPLAPGTPGGEDDEGDEDWVRETDRTLASRIARQVKAWLAGGHGLSAGDVMILCRKRGELAALIVARLIEEKIDVAGVDRLRLQAPLAVQDVLSAMRFVLQPRDDLNLAALLVSPLLGWSQDDLFAVAQPRGDRALWDAVPEGTARDRLRGWLAMADLTTPYRFLEAVLMPGRHALLARLGEEARDPLDELLLAALQFEREGIPTLQGFVDWFDRGEAEIKRDADAAGNAVRVMTVHGAKGLQAPLVILADACANPDNARENALEWQLDELSDALPMFTPRKAERQLCEALAAAHDDAKEKSEREHWRLLYVAMTRAERTLIVAGALSTRDKGAAPAKSWHATIGAAMTRMGAPRVQLADWGETQQWGEGLGPFKARDKSAAGSPADRPAWLDQAAPAEARPPRPLAPSSLGEDDDSHPPPSAAMAAAAERGRLLHALFERLPALSPLERRAAGRAWLDDVADADALLDTALSVIEHPDYTAMFTPDALAEAPIAGVVDGVVVAGTVDRLVVTPEHVFVVDFKTGRRVPGTHDAIPRAHVRQMAAYVAVLAQVYPGRSVEAALLYSEGPVLHRLPPALLAVHKPDYQGAQDKLALSL